MTTTQLRLLQYNVNSHSRKGEVVKQQLIQTALQQGLCDIALVQGCTGIHEPPRSGTGAVYQSANAYSSSAPSDSSSSCQAGTLLCYTAERFKVRQLSSVPEDLPGFVHSILLLQDIHTGTAFIAIVMASNTCTDPALCDSAPLAKLWFLMKELSSQCPVLAAAECTLTSPTDRLCSDASVHLHLCQPVHAVNSINQSFFATVCSSQQQIHISNVESLLARPAAASVQYTQNAHTAACCIAANGASSSSTPSDSAVDEAASADQKGVSGRPFHGSGQQGSQHIAAQLQVLVNAASAVSFHTFF